MKSSKIFFLTILAIACLGQFSTDIYAGVMGNMALELEVDISLIQKTMAIFMLGLSGSQLLYGAASEVWGRKKPLVFGLLLMLGGTLCCLVAKQAFYLLLGRLIQGCGLGSCAALWRAIFRDKFQGAELARYGSYFSIAIIFVIPAAPAIGSYVTKFWSWRAAFSVIFFYTLVCLYLMIFHFKETSPQQDNDFSIKRLLRQYQALFTQSQFIRNTLGTCICYGGFFAWFVAGPVLFTESFGLQPVEYGWLSFWVASIAMGTGGMLNGRLVTRYGTDKMLRGGLILMSISNGGLWGILVLGMLSPITLSVIMFLFYLGVTLIWPNAFANAFEKVAHLAGCAGALYGFMQIFGGALIGGALSYLPSYSAYPLALVNLGVILLAGRCFAKKTYG